MRTQKNVAQLMIALDLEYAEAAKVADLASNELGIACILDASGTLDSTECFDDTTNVLATGDKFQAVLKRADGSLERSDIIDFDDIVAVHIVEGTAAVEQVDYIGYNAVTTTGSIDVINSNPYYATFLLQGGNMATFAEREKLFAIYKSDSTATQYEIANGLATTAVENMKYFRKGYKPLQFDVVCSDDGTNNAADAGADYTHLTFTKGSKYAIGTIDGADALGSDETNDDLIEGTFVRAGTAVTDPVYKVITATAGTAGTAFILTLDRAYEGDTESIAIAGTQVITAAEGAAADWGVKVTGVTPSVIAGYVHKEPIRFESAILDAGDTTLSKEAAKATRGIGTADYIAQLEKELEGTRGVVYRSSPQYELPRTSYASISSGGLYDLVSITYKKRSVNMLDADTISHGELIIAVDDGDGYESNFAGIFTATDPTA